MQGLLVCDADGNVLYQRELPHDVIRDCVAMANELGERQAAGSRRPLPLPMPIPQSRIDTTQ